MGLMGGKTGTNTLTGPSEDCEWTVTGDNKGTVGSTSFSNIATLITGSQKDTIQFAGSYQISGGITGNGSDNTVMGPDSDTNAWMITGNNQGTLKPKSIVS